MLLTEYDEVKIKKLFIKDGERNRAIKDIRNLMESLELSTEQAMDALKIPAEEQSILLKLL